LPTGRMSLNIDYIRSKYEIDDEISVFEGSKYASDGIAIVGQDSGITTSSKVRSVLMLDDRSSRLCRYISTHILGKVNRKLEEVIAFNLIDINFSTSIREIANNEGYDFYELVDCLAEHSYQNFLARLDKYSPRYLITLGKPVFLFLSKKSGKKLEFKEFFATQIKIYLEGHSLIWLPCVHVNTFDIYRLVYGEQDDRLERLANNI
jgi:hypothetical protein